MGEEWVAKARFERRGDAERAASRLRESGSTLVRRGSRSLWVVVSDEVECKAAASRLRQLGALREPVDVRRLGFLDRWRLHQGSDGDYGSAGGSAYGDAGSSHHDHGGSHHGHGSHDGGGWGGGHDGGGWGGDGGGGGGNGGS